MSGNVLHAVSGRLEPLTAGPGTAWRADQSPWRYRPRALVYLALGGLFGTSGVVVIPGRRLVSARAWHAPSYGLLWSAVRPYESASSAWALSAPGAAARVRRRESRP